MQRRHFELIAETVRVRLVDLSKVERQIVAEAFADSCGGTNPLFDRGRFLRACGCQEA